MALTDGEVTNYTQDIKEKRLVLKIQGEIVLWKMFMEFTDGDL